jgi:hypothetical protein
MFSTKNRNFKINVIGFSLMGVLYYLYSFIQDPSTLKANPLYVEGAYGIPISVIGASITYYYFRYSEFPLFRIGILAFALFIIWIAGVMYIGSNLKGSENITAAVAWIGLLTIMYFMFIGAINGLFGFWISLFNLFVLVNALVIGNSTDPIAWVNVLGLVGIENPILQWGIIFISAILGISDKGYEFLLNQESITT